MKLTTLYSSFAIFLYLPFFSIDTLLSSSTLQFSTHRAGDLCKNHSYFPNKIQPNSFCPRVPAWLTSFISLISLIKCMRNDSVAAWLAAAPFLFPFSSSSFSILSHPLSKSITSSFLLPQQKNLPLHRLLFPILRYRNLHRIQQVLDHRVIFCTGIDNSVLICLYFTVVISTFARLVP